ncbi:hypothetical protein RHGRI_021643 [Rhododendron griersonianum]|uniref:Transmembrane protein n=1 Tax=Rhododendron griersonianum TaxID=479676 RepID=A0AAV6JKW9_9ERIC|nr:hypothetical protein RHGRI_021643 [Rhododendron griersonianum]
MMPNLFKHPNHLQRINANKCIQLKIVVAIRICFAHRNVVRYASILFLLMLFCLCLMVFFAGAGRSFSVNAFSLLLFPTLGLRRF